MVPWVATLVVTLAVLVAVLSGGLCLRNRRRFQAQVRSLGARAERLRRAEELAGLGEYDWNVDTGEVRWSERLYQIFGIDPDAGVDAVRSFGAIHEEDAQRMADVTEQLLAGAEPTHNAFRIVRPDGSVRHLVGGGEMFTIDGVRHVHGVMQDMTEMVEVRNYVGQVEEQYRYLFERNPVPMWIFERESLLFLAVNDAMLRHYGYAREDLVGASILSIRPVDEAKAVQQLALSESSERPQGRVWTHLRKDGSRIRVAIFSRDIEFNGRSARLIAGQDVTERERVEDRFRLVARVTSDAVYDYDLLSGEAWWSDSFHTQLGLDRREVRPAYETWESLLHPDDRARVVASRNEAIHSRLYAWEAEYRFRRGDGSFADISDRASLLRDVDGRAKRMVGGMEDISARRRSEGDLRLLRRAIEATDSGVLIADARAPDLPIVYVNRGFEEITGYSAAEFVGQNCRRLQGSDRDQPQLESLRLALAEARETRVLLRNFRKDGTLFWNELHLAPVRDEQGELTHFVGAINDVTERQRFEDRLAHRATHDELTTLPNRVLLEDRLQQAILNAQRNGGRAGVVFIDLDDFKLINDSLGHNAGDATLREVASRLQQAVRVTDTVGRFGGDEFVVVVSEHNDEDRIGEIVNRIAQAMRTPLQLNNTSHTLSASIGYCRYPDDGSHVEELLMRADMAMYQAKHRGRNRAVGYRVEFDAGVSQRLQLMAQLREALEFHEFILVFQPLYSSEGRLVAVEALVRWRHPTRGMLLPVDFISVCEETGLIVELGRWVLHEAARHHGMLMESGLGDVRISVNVSAAQFTEELYRDVGAVVDEFMLPRGILELELTESLLMDNPTQAIELMQRLAGLGVAFSVDDFGTGYSSLSYLKRFPIGRLKIDRSFVQELGHNDDDGVICQLIIGLAHSLGIRTVAEGVETAQQMEWLRERGCDELQGYLLGWPQPLEKMLGGRLSASASG